MTQNAIDRIGYDGPALPVTVKSNWRDAIDILLYASTDEEVGENVGQFLDACNESASSMRFAVGLKTDGVRLGLASWDRTGMMLKGVDIASLSEEQTIRELRSWTHDDTFKVGFAQSEDESACYTATVGRLCWSDHDVIELERKLPLSTALVVAHLLSRLRASAGDEVTVPKPGLIYRTY